MPVLAEFFALFQEDITDGDKRPYTQERTNAFRRRILRSRTKKRLEWLDAMFVQRDGQWHVHQQHQRVNHQLEAQEKIPLDDILLEAGSVHPSSFSVYGLPRELSTALGSLDYQPPQDRCVAGLLIDQQGAHLLCNLNPNTLDLYATVRLAYTFRSNVHSLESHIISPKKSSLA